MGLQANIIYQDRHGNGDRYLNTTVYITLTDEATGLPANGNNVAVDYQITERVTDVNMGAYYENTSLQRVTIPGQSVAIDVNQDIYRKEVNADGVYVTAYFRDYTITGISDVPNPAPPVNSCDLVLNYISIDQPESSPGASDAMITIGASSSYLPIRYSLDNINFQTSNTFSGLNGGLKTVYVTDANTIGCATNKTVAIPILSNLLTSDSSVNVGGNISRWNAAFNPVVFTYQRKDFTITSVTADSESGNAKLAVNANVASVLPGEMVYVNTSVYKGAFKVKHAETNALIIEKPYTTNATGFVNINSLRPYYKLLTRITYNDALTGEQKTIDATNRPDNTGLIRADISNFLQSLLQIKDQSDYTQINFRDDNLSASYSLAYAEHWDDNTAEGHSSAWITLPHPYYVVYAAKQLGERYGGNLAAYVPFANGTPPAKWITDFAEPAYSNNYPFDIGFIYGEDLLGRALYYELTLLDINRAPLSGGNLQSGSLLNEDSSWLLNQDGSKYVIADANGTTCPVPAQLGLNRLLINSTFPDDAYYFNIVLKFDDENNITHTVTQTQTVRIDKAGDDQSVYLRWIGLSGSWNYYRFVYNQEVTLDVQNATIIKNYVHDWENQDSIEDVISKTAGQKMKVIAEDLSVNDIKGLQSIKYSPKVQMLVNKNPVKWQTVILNTATFNEYETRNGQAPFSITFNMPAINIQTQ